MSATETRRSVFDLVGGQATFQALAAAFYRGVEKDPLLRPMYPANLWGHKRTANSVASGPEGKGLCSPVDSLAAFLGQFFGGPALYSEARGHPRLKMRHVRFKIGQAERDAWLSHMCAAIAEVGIEEPMASLMRQYFDQTSTFLINTASDSSQ